MNTRTWLVGIALTALPLFAIASDTLTIDSMFVRIGLARYAGLFVDTTGEQTLEDLLQQQPPFIAGYNLEQEGPYPVAYWLRIPVVAKEDITGARIVVPGNPETGYTEHRLDYMDAYLVDQDGAVRNHGRSGFFVPRSEKKLPAHYMVAAVPVSLEAGRHYELYVRLQNATDPQTAWLGLELRSASAGLPSPDFGLRWVILGPWGMFIIIGLYVLVFFYYVRDRAFLYFGIFCLLYSLDLLSTEPEGGLLGLIPEHPEWSAPIFYAHLFSLTFLMLFGREFIDIKARFPRWSRYYQFVLILLAAVTAFYFIRNFWKPYQVIQPWLILSFLLFIPFCIRFVLSTNWPARLFGAGFFSFVAGNIIGVFAIINGHKWGPVSWMVGQVTLLFLFAAGLGYRLLEGERQQAQAEKMQDLDRLKTRFFTNISHEFRTPLSLILGPLQRAAESVPFSEMQDDDNEIPVRAAHIQLMKRNALRMEELIDQILDLSKIESGKMELRLQRGDVLKFIRSRVAEFEDIAGRNGIHLVASYSEAAAEACFDPDKLEKILVNLLSNAVKFTPFKGEVRVMAEASGQYLKIKVTDTGPGMSQVEAEHIFDRFYQADKAAQQGSGIGMALVKELVELHHGRVSVDSQLGAGTSITCRIGISPNLFSPEEFSTEPSRLAGESTLPYRLPASEKPPEAVPVAEGSEKESLVLVVEDNVGLQAFLQEILSEQHRVLLAGNGREGVEKALEHLPDLVVSDVMMPEMSGIELCDHLKKEEKTSHIPILLLTAKAEQKDKLAGLSTGADDYLTKPFDAKELLVKVSNLIRIREQLREKYSKHPWSPALQSVTSLEERFLQNVMAAIRKNLSNEYYSVEELGRDVGYSRSQLFRKLKALTGKTPLEQIRRQRLYYARELLEKRSGTVSEVAYQVGYSNLSYFSRSFREEFGISPSEVK
ncbi:MAG: response regulator [Phaeodactylibacter sp.]|nr:response regulator [Phaeodactylibacter sp.]